MRKIIFLALLLILLVIFLCQWPDNRLRVVFCPVGQGDAILIKRGFTQILIDAGPDDSVLACLAGNMPFWDKRIELAILTHPEADHFNGLIEVLRRYRVDRLAANPFGPNDNLAFRKLVNLVVEQKIETVSLTQGDKIRAGLVSFDILWPGKNNLIGAESINGENAGFFRLINPKSVQFNEFSIVSRLVFGNFSLLLAADLPAEKAQILAWRGQLTKAEVIKVSHHGSAADNPDELYLATQPNLAVISVGKNNFGHPSSELLEKLEKWGTEIKRTDRDGEIKIVSNGKKWEIGH